MLQIADLILSKLSDKNLDLNVGNVDGMTVSHSPLVVEP